MDKFTNINRLYDNKGRELWTVAYASKQIRLQRRTIRLYADMGIFAGVKVGNTWLIYKDSMRDRLTS